jgi:hypothetical protein
MSPSGKRGDGTSDDVRVALDTLANLDPAELRGEWRRLYRSPPPRRAKRDLLQLGIAWKLQECVYGGLAASQKKKLQSIAKDPKGNGNPGGATAIRIKPGARLIREWGGKTYSVLVRDDGFEWNGELYASLSAIAREITGTRWSGPRFFGLQRKTKPVGVVCLDG